MVAARKAFFVLVVMLLAPMASAIDSSQSSEDDILDKASSNWHSMEPADTIQSGLKSLDYNVHLSIGSFDPLTDDFPKSRLDDSQDFRQTGMAVIALQPPILALVMWIVFQQDGSPAPTESMIFILALSCS